MLQHRIYPILSKEAQEHLEQQFHKITGKDERGQNKEGILDIDLLMLQVFSAISLSKKSSLEHYGIVFSSFDM